MKINYKIIESIVNSEVKWFFENSDYDDWNENRWFSWGDKFEDICGFEFEKGESYVLGIDGGINSFKFEIDEENDNLICDENEFKVYSNDGGWIIVMK